MFLDYHNNNREFIYNNKNNKKTDIEDITNHIYNNYLLIIRNINEYSRKLHYNIHKISILLIFNDSQNASL